MRAKARIVVPFIVLLLAPGADCARTLSSGVAAFVAVPDCWDRGGRGAGPGLGGDYVTGAGVAGAVAVAPAGPW